MLVTDLLQVVLTRQAVRNMLLTTDLLEQLVASLLASSTLLQDDNINLIDACDVTLSVYPHRASLKNMPDHGGKHARFSSLPGVDIHSE
jgi:hypothetical protein